MSLVVVGASLAGLHAAEAARRAGYEGAITLAGAESHLPYDRPPLSKAALATGPEPAPTTLRTAAELAELDVRLLLGRPAVGLDLDRRRVLLDVGDATAGGTRRAADGSRDADLDDRDAVDHDSDNHDALAFDSCVLATGSHARHLSGERLPGVLVLRTLDDARVLRTALDAARRVVVVGAGLIGSEVATAARARGAHVTVVEAATQPMQRVVGEQLAPRIRALHAGAGVELRCGSGVETLEGDGRVERVHLADGSVLPADLVVVGAGSIPSTGWLQGSGLELADGVVCDAGLRAAAGVWAAGDVARWPNALFGESMRLEHWTSAMEQGAHVGRAAADPSAAEAFTTVPYAWSELYGHLLQAVGLPTGADEVELVESGERWVALSRRGDLLRGAVCLDTPGRTMKLRRLIGAGGSFTEAVALVRR